MFIKKTIPISAKNELHLFGADLLDTERYVCPNITGVYVLSSSNLNILNTTNSGTFKYLVNVIPYRAADSVQLKGYIYKGTVSENPQILVYSNASSMSSVFGVHLNTATNCAKINIADKTITTSSEVKNYCVFNYDMNVGITNKLVSSKPEFVYLENCIIDNEIDATYEQAIHPLMSTKLRGLMNFLENGNTTSYRYKIYSMSGNLSDVTYINLYKLKMLFSIDGNNWYKYNTTSELFESVTPSGSYFTFNELGANGNDYTTYTQIPIAKYTNTFGANISKIKIITNGWLLPRIIKHSFYNDKLDSSKFIWNITAKESKNLVSVGDI